MATPAIFLGIDPSGARQPFLYAALDERLSILTLAEGAVEEVLNVVAGAPNLIVAVNAPSRPNMGLVRQSLSARGATASTPRHLDLRLAEADLRARGISVAATPSRAETCPAWMQIGFDLYRRLEATGVHPYHPGLTSPLPPRLWIETHPHACYCALIGQLPLPRSTLEGRLQRQAILYDLGISLPDPMDFFEEITRHRLRLAHLPLNRLLPAEHLDVLVAAYTAWLVSHHPDQITCLGADPEGWIILPVRQLKDRYPPSSSWPPDD